MIKSFGNKETEKVWNGQRSKKLPNDIQEIARRKLIEIMGEDRDDLFRPNNREDFSSSSSDDDDDDQDGL